MRGISYLNLKFTIVTIKDFRCNNVVFRLEENDDDFLIFDVVLIDCPETNRIIKKKKHEDLVRRRHGNRKIKNRFHHPGSSLI